MSKKNEKPVVDFDATVLKLEKQLIVQALASTDTVSDAAKYLGLGRTTLQAKLKRMKIDIPCKCQKCRKAK